MTLSSGEAKYLAESVAYTATQHIRMTSYNTCHLTDKDIFSDKTKNTHQPM